MEFDGDGDYVDITATQDKNTISLWYKNSTASSWTHIVNASGTIYINGVTGTASQYPIYINGNKVEIGKTGASSYFNGTIDDVMIFSRALSSEEIIGLYANTSSKYLFHNFTELGLGNYTFKAYAQDTSGNVNWTEEREVVKVEIEDTTAPNVVLNFPEDDTTLSYTNVIFNCTSYDNFNLANVSLYFSSSEITGWTAYNDAGDYGNPTWGSIGNVTNFGVDDAPGNLVKYSDNSDTGVQIEFSGSSLSEGSGADTNHGDLAYPLHGDAATEFGGIINVAKISYATIGNDLIVNFSGLTGADYTLVALGMRTNYNIRWCSYTISDVDSFTYASSLGAEASTTTLADDTTIYKCGDNWNEGYVAKWTNIVPTNGNILITIKGVDHNGDLADKAYLSAIKLSQIMSYDIGWHANQTRNISGIENETIFSLDLKEDTTYTWNCLAVDEANNQNFSSSNYTFNISIDSPPEVTLILPFYSDILNDVDVTFKCLARDDYGLENITLYYKDGGAWHAEQTKSLSGTYSVETFPLTLLDKTNYEWNCLACDDLGSCVFAIYNYTFLIDSDYIPPFTSVWIPTNATHSSGLDVTAKVNASDDALYADVNKNENITVYSWNESLSEEQILRYVIAHVKIDVHDRGAKTYLQTNNTGKFETCGECISDAVVGHNLICHLTISCGIDTNDEVNNLKLRTVVEDPGGPPNAASQEDYIWLDVAYRYAPVVYKPRTYDNLTLLEKTVFEREEELFVNVSVIDREGREDIEKVNISILDPTGNVVVDNASMVKDINITINDINGSVYNYSWKIPEDAPGGNWTINIFATDKAGNKDYNTTNFSVLIEQQPPEIVWVQNISDVIPLAGGVRDVSFVFTVYDGNGFDDLTDGSARANFTKEGYTDVQELNREDLSCSRIAVWNDNYANYSCTIGMWYYDEPGWWNVTVTIADKSGQWGMNDSESFFYNSLDAINITSVLDWETVHLGQTNLFPAENMSVENIGNIEINGLEINASNLVGEDLTIFGVGNFSVSSDIDGCAGMFLEAGVELPIDDASLDVWNNTFDGEMELYFCLREVPDLPLQEYSTPAEIPWQITILAVALVIKRKRKKKKSKKEILEIFDKRLKRGLSIKQLLNLSEDLREKYKVSIEDLLEIAKKKLEEAVEIRIPIIIFKQGISPAEVLCKYLKENKGLRFSEIAKLINRDERTVWINYRGAVEKKKEKIKVEKKALVSVKVFADRRLSVLESVVNYLKGKGFRNSEIAEMLNKDQRNVYTLYSRAKKKLG